MSKRGYMEQITFPSTESGRNRKYHLALVRVPGEDDYEVGLKALYYKLGVSTLNPDLIRDLMQCRPEAIHFEGNEIYYPIHSHNIEITDESAEEWVQRLKSHP